MREGRVAGLDVDLNAFVNCSVKPPHTARYVARRRSHRGARRAKVTSAITVKGLERCTVPGGYAPRRVLSQVDRSRTEASTESSVGPPASLMPHAKPVRPVGARRPPGRRSDDCHGHLIGRLSTRIHWTLKR
ncbi:unnamed protein product [Lota lota]